MKLIEKDSFHQSLGSYLRDKRIEAGYTQAEIARHLGYSTPQFISNFERGLCSPPLKNLKVLIKLYDIPVDEVMGLILNEQEDMLRKALDPRSSKKKRKA